MPAEMPRFVATRGGIEDDTGAHAQMIPNEKL
jgi:hypothetical protein